MKQNKSHKSLGEVFLAYDYPEYTDDIDRFSKLASWTIECIRWFDGRVDRVYLEDYAFAATGRVFNIGENTGILKKQLKEAGFKYVTIPPTVIKKHATGKGNANKESLAQGIGNLLCGIFGGIGGAGGRSGAGEAVVVWGFGWGRRVFRLEKKWESWTTEYDLWCC